MPNYQSAKSIAYVRYYFDQNYCVTRMLGLPALGLLDKVSSVVRGASALDDGWFQLLLGLQPWAAICVPYLLRQRRDIHWAHSGRHIPRQIRKYVRLAEKC